MPEGDSFNPSFQLADRLQLASSEAVHKSIFSYSSTFCSNNNPPYGPRKRSKRNANKATNAPAPINNKYSSEPCPEDEYRRMEASNSTGNKKKRVQTHPLT
jgi:hypothetical protein